MIAHNQIIQEVALWFNVRELDLISKCDSAQYARFVAAHLCVELTNSNHTEIAKMLGYKDHKSIVSAHTYIKNEMVGDTSFTKSIETMKISLKYKERLINSSNIDIFKLAKSVVLQPKREAISLSVDQIVVLAMGYLEMRSVALAGEHLANEMITMVEMSFEELVSKNAEEGPSLYEISKSIIETMAHMAGEPEGNDNATGN